MEVKPGGVWLFTMEHPQWGVYRNRARYLEIERGRRLVYLHDAGVDNDPAEFKVTITFEAQRDKTLVTMHSLFLTAAEVERVKGFGAVELGKQTLAHLSDYLTRQAA
jgi:uncharacterized protein YndB with AHSA1/START domain